MKVLQNNNVSEEVETGVKGAKALTT